MAYSAPSTISTGDLCTAAIWNADVVANAIALHAGAMSVTSQAVGDILYASSTTQLGRIAAVATGQVLTSAGTGTVPAWSSNVDLGGTLDVAGAVTFNDAGADVDLRVETSGDQYAFTINGGTNNVGIGEADPGHKFTVSGTNGAQGSLAAFDTSAERIANLQAGSAAHADRQGNLQIWGTNDGQNDSIAIGSTGSADVDLLFATRRSGGTASVNLRLKGDGTNEFTGTVTAPQYLSGTSAAISPDATTNLYASSGASGPDGGLLALRDGYNRFALFWYGSYDTLTKIVGNSVYSATKDNATTINIYYESGNIVYQNKTAIDPFSISYTRLLY